MRRVLRTARQRLAMAAAGFFTAVFLLSVLQVVGGALVNLNESRAGVPPESSWAISIAQGDQSDMAQVNHQIYELLVTSNLTTVAAAEYGMIGAPALAVLDNRPQPVPLFNVKGRWFTHQEMTASQPSLIIREDSYLASNPTLGGGEAILVPGKPIGTFDASLPTSFQFAINMSAYQPAVLPSQIYVASSDVTLAAQIVGVLGDHADASIALPVSVSKGMRSAPLLGPMALGSLISLAILGMALVDGIAADRSRWRIARLLGATRCRAAWGQAWPRGVDVMVSAVTGVLALSLAVPDGTRFLPTGWPMGTGLVAVAIPATVATCVAFVASLVQHLRYREWLA